MKYRTKSANVLNEADRYERILNLQLFHMEQENLLWGYNEEVEWLPGDPIYQDPRTVYRASCNCCEEPHLEGYYGNHVRPMFQTYTYADSRTVVYGEPSWSLNQYYKRMRCQDCDVDWTGNEPCWVCGVLPQKNVRPNYIEVHDEAFLFQNLPPLPAVSYHDPAADMMVWLRNELRVGLEEELGRSWRNMMERLLVSADEFRTSFSRVSDSFSAFGRYSAADIALTRHMYHTFEPMFSVDVEPNTNPFEREMPERFVLPSISDSVPEFDTHSEPRPMRPYALELPYMAPEQLGPQVLTGPTPELSREPIELPRHLTQDAPAYPIQRLRDL